MPFTDKALTVAEAAEITGFSRRTVIRMFENERGVLVVKRPEKMHKRGYRSIRIPRVVFDRVIRNVTVQQPFAPALASLPIYPYPAPRL